LEPSRRSRIPLVSPRLVGGRRFGKLPGGGRGRGRRWRGRAPSLWVRSGYGGGREEAAGWGRREG
jgi:hypothetical protein